MSLPAVQPRPIANRTRALVVPREHGAWGILLVPLATGAAVGLLSHGRVLPLVYFAVAAVALFWLRTPVESLLRTTPMRAQSTAERRTVAIAIALLCLAAVAALLALLWRGQNLGLVALGGVAASAFAAQAVVKQIGRSTRMTAQLVGSIGLTCTAPAAYYVVTGHLDTRALGLWLANWIFAGNQIHYVQVRIHAARIAGWTEKFTRARSFFFGHVVMAFALVLAWRLGLLPLLALGSFAPIFLRGLAWFFRAPSPLNVHRLGLAELTHAIAFGVLFLLAFRFSG